MNKIFLWIVLAVIILGLLLILLNTRMGQSGDAPVPADNSVSAPVKPAPPVAQPPLPVTPDTPADGEKLAAAGVKPSPAAVERGFAFETGEETPATAESPAPASPGTTPLTAAAHDEKAPAAAPAAPAAPAEVKKAEKPAPKPQPAPKNQTITNFVVFVRDGGATIRLDASSPIRFKHLELTSPSRVVVDLHGTWKLSEPGVPKGEMVKDVRLGKKGSDTRIVIDLHAKAKTRYILTKGKKRLDIRLDKTK
ncbi:AMIN domain-containing protein [Desulfovibrio sp.]|uniref:AMIN domain-containing protein n=1 Tax=Desulfovibrio sp. TaxID=885 RepID=UPI003AB71BAE